MSYVRVMVTDSGTFKDPTWDAVESELRALNATTNTIVMLSPAGPAGTPADERHMAVGGGDEHLIVYVTEDNLRFWNAVDPSRQTDDTILRITIGGQEGEYRISQCVTRQAALRAARQYVEDGSRTADLAWTTG